MNKENIYKKLEIILPGFFLLYYCFYFIYTNVQYEDAWITYRYAANILKGNGFVYNIGEKVLGTTTPLYTLLLAIIGYVSKIPVPIVSQCLNSIFFALSIYFVIKTLKLFNIGYFYIFLVSFLYALHPYLFPLLLSGMETSLLILLMNIILFLFLKDEIVLMSIPVGLIILTRYDAGIFILLITIVITWYKKQIPYKFIILVTLIIIPWLIFSFIYFGNIIPQSLTAKFIEGQYSYHSLIDEMNFYLCGLGSSKFYIYIPFLILCCFGVRQLYSIDRKYSIIIIVFIIVYPLLFGIGKAGHFNWYLAPIAWAACYLEAFGILTIHKKIRNKLFGKIFLTLVVVFISITSFVKVYVSKEAWENKIFIDQWLNKNTNKNAIVALEPIGYIGYHSENKILDLAGLISPNVTEIRKIDQEVEYKWLFKIWAIQKPDYIILRQWEVEENKSWIGGKFFADAKMKSLFQQMYQPVFLSNGLIIYRLNR